MVASGARRESKPQRKMTNEIRGNTKTTSSDAALVVSHSLPMSPIYASTAEPEPTARMQPEHKNLHVQRQLNVQGPMPARRNINGVRRRTLSKRTKQKLRALTMARDGKGGQLIEEAGAAAH
jgi:hypothetical protein